MLQLKFYSFVKAGVFNSNWPELKVESVSGDLF